jgi:hypothetical protein
MAARQLSFDFTPIGGSKVAVRPMGRKGSTINDHPTFEPLTEPESTAYGQVAVFGPLHQNKAIYEINWLFTEEQRGVIEKGFVLFEARGIQGLDPQFIVEDELVLVANTYPASRSYVPGSLIVDASGTVPTSRLFARRKALFASQPTITSRYAGSSGCMYELSFTIVEGELLTAVSAGQTGTI